MNAILIALALAWGAVALGDLPAQPPEQSQPQSQSQPPGNTRQPLPAAKKSPATPARVNDLDVRTAQWLVDLAQHQGHLVGRSSPRSASLHVIALLEAARETDPACGEACYWLYDLYQRMGRADPARQALARYVELTPGDDAARLRLLALNIEALQSAEQRLAFVTDELKQKNLSPVYESELRRLLAKQLDEQRDIEEAGKEIERSLRLNPANIAARELAYAMFGETEAALQRVELALNMISMNPTQAGLVWELGEFLDRLSLHKEAQEWFNRAIDMHRRAEAKPVPADYWLKLAMSYLSSDEYQRAREAADAALVADQAQVQARLLRATACEKLGDLKAAESDRAAALQYYESLVPEIIEGKQPEKAAEAAWYFCYHQPDAKRAMELSTAAAQDKQAPSLAALARGYALRLNGKSDEAIEALKPLAGRDQLAALELARALVDRGDKAEAIGVLQKAAALQCSGIAYRQIASLLDKYGEKAPQPADQVKVKEALARFHRDVFDFPRKPESFLQCGLRFEEPISPLGPIRATIRMENVGPFAITLGEGFMVRPLAALSARLTSGDQATDFKNYQQVLVHRRPVLLPGDAIEKTVSIDVGPLRQHLLRSVLRPTTIELTALIDPVFEGGELTAGPGTVRVGPVRAGRPILDISPTAVSLLIDQAQDRNPRRRIESAQGIAAILVAAAGQPVEADLPADRLRAALQSLVADGDWHVRAQALAACEWLSLDGPMTQAAAPSIKDDHAVVRLMAVRLFAAKQGGQFKPVLEQLGKADQSPFVRMICASFLPEPAAQASAGGE